MSRKLLAAASALALLLGGCGSLEPRVEYRYIDRPVEVATVPSNAIRLPMRMYRGTPHVKVDVCSQTKCYDFWFTVDSGAADVAIWPGLFRAMVQDGVVTRGSVIDVANYSTASGMTRGLRFWMPLMRVGGVEVTQVVGSVSPDHPQYVALLGQSFLRKFKHWSIDNTRRELVLVPY